jgi:hypothetical protein
MLKRRRAVFEWLNKDRDLARGAFWLAMAAANVAVWVVFADALITWIRSAR